MVMRKFKGIYILILAMSVILQSCFIISNEPEVLLRKNFDGNGIAVLNFSRGESSQIDDIGKVAADKLTNALFLKGRFNVIDRSKVNEVEASLGIKSPDILSAGQIEKLGSTLKANYLVLGKVQKIGGDDYFDPSSNKKLYVTLRILSTDSSQVVGIATYSLTYNDNETVALGKIMNKIVEEMRWK